MTRRQPKVSVWVPWGTDQCECKIGARQWQRIIDGEDESCSFTTSYEEWSGTVYFNFNGESYGSLHASYGEEGCEMFLGGLDEASIVVDGKEVRWSEVSRPDAPSQARR